MTRYVRLALPLALALSLIACEGARQAGSGAKKAGSGMVRVLSAPSRLLAGNPPDYAKRQGMTEEDLRADAPPEVSKREIKKQTKVKPAIMGTSEY